jgi:CRP-like cAMP-binding protein
MSDLRLVDKFNVAYPEMYSQFVQISRELKNRVPNYSGREVFSTIKTNRVMAGLSSFTMGHNLQTQYLRAVEQRETDLTGFFTDTGSRAYTKDKARVAPVVGPTKKSKTKPAKRVSAIDTVYLKILGSVESGLNEREIVKVTNYQRETVCSILNKLRSTGRTRLTEIERPGGKVYIANL